ncbi:MAG: hypothetical protein AAB229_03470, partial [Candidatus Hydrogenedentota bacterium]
MSTPETFSAEPRAAETAKIVALPSAQPGAAAAQPVSPDEESVAGGTAVLDDDVYGFQEKPFHVTPDARMVYAHRRYEEALSALNYSVMKGKGFAVITGEVLPIRYGIIPVSQDEPALALERVRYVGEPVAAVAADDEEL